MAHDVHLQSLDNAGVLDRLIADLQADDLFEWQDMRAAQIKVRVRRREPVKVRAADGRKEQRVRLGGNDSVQSRINCHENNRFKLRIDISRFRLARSSCFL